MMVRTMMAAAVATAGLSASGGWALADAIALRVAGNFSQNQKHIAIEQARFDGLSEATGIDIAVNYNPMDVVGVKAPDALRLLKSGAFDVMSVQIGMASRDDPFFEGVDLIGVSTDLDALRKAVDAYRGVFDARLQEKFNAKVLTLWPFGPQMFYCNHEIGSLDDIAGLKVRSFTPSMSALLEAFGATPVTLQFSEVYPALQKGVASCGVTSPTSGNSGKWPEVTTHFLPLSVSGSVQGHFINLDAWNRFDDAQKGEMETAFKALEDDLWALAAAANNDAIRCNTGQEPCEQHTKFNMTLVKLSPDDEAKLKAATTGSVLPIWKESCNAVSADCTATWNDTVGAAVGMKIE